MQPMVQTASLGPNRSATVATEDGVRLDVSVWTVRCAAAQLARAGLAPTQLPTPACACSGARPSWLSKPVIAVLVHQWSKMGGCQSIMRGLALHLAQKGLRRAALLVAEA